MARTRRAAAEKVSVYEVVTARILAALEKGVVPWRMPWRRSAGGSGMPANLMSGRDYRGINVLLLGCQGFTSRWWVSFRQAQELGGTVRKGEKGTPVVFWKVYEDEKTEEKRFVLRYSTVFNVTQCDGLEHARLGEKAPEADAFAAVARAEEIVAAYFGREGAPAFSERGDQACYAPLADEVRVPARASFETPAAFYSTTFHEMTHSTGHPRRLDREGIRRAVEEGRVAFGSHEYSFEELVAECGAAFLSAEAGTVDETIEASAAYIKGWVRKLSDDPKWIVQAAGKASRAAEHVLGPRAVAEDGGEESEKAA